MFSLFSSSSSTSVSPSAPLVVDTTNGSYNGRVITLNVGVHTFKTTSKTLQTFAPHQLSELLEECKDVTIFVDQDAALFPRILQYLRAGHEIPSFIEELTQVEIWTLYEQNRDYYHIKPLNDFLERRLFPEAKTQIPSTIAAWLSFIKSMSGISGLGELKEMADDIGAEIKQDVCLNDTFENEDNDSKYLNLAYHKSNFTRYNRNKYHTKSISRIGSILFSKGMSIVLNYLKVWPFCANEKSNDQRRQSKSSESSESSSADEEISVNRKDSISSHIEDEKSTNEITKVQDLESFIMNRKH